VVRPGDSLWRLAAERLPEDADNATIAHTWQRLYAANRDVIGPDPDRLEPGQQLARPRVW
jgi:nucleoid-associated protein YgaU